MMLKLFSRWREDWLRRNRPEKISHLKRNLAVLIGQIRAVEAHNKGNSSLLQRFGLVEEVERNPDLLSTLLERKKGLQGKLREEQNLAQLDRDSGYIPRERKRIRNFVSITLNRVRSLVFSLVVIGVLLIPTWLFIVARIWISPEGFWQNLALTGVGLWFFGGIQFFILFIALLIWLQE